MMYLSKIIMLFTLNLYSAICQLYLNKTGREKIKIYFKKSETKWIDPGNELMA